MTNKTLTLRSLDIPSIHRFGIGFDSMLDELMRSTSQQAQNYPPYNIVKLGEDKFNIEVAVSGFREGDLTITIEKNILNIRGQQTYSLDELDNPDVEYLHRGISARDFLRTFTLAEHVEVIDASVKHGILTVALERKVPESQKPRRIEVGFTK